MKCQFLAIAFITISMNAPLLCSDFLMGNTNKSLDIFDSIDDLEENLFIDGFLDISPVTTRQIDVKTILGLLESIGAFTLLDQDFYKRTNPFIQRSLLDLPVFEIHGCREPDNWIVGANFFWNHMDRSVFICNKTSINSFLDLEQETLFTALDELTAQVKALFPNASIVDDILNTTNMKELLTLFENFTVQQRRVGIMFHAWRQWQNIEIRMLWPLYYLERNVFAQPGEQAAIEDQFGALDPNTTQIFQKNHAISDKFGFGDFRGEFDYMFYQFDTFACRFGAFVTLPIAFAISKGLQGSNFLKNLQQPTFNLQALFDLIPEDFNVDAITPEELEEAHDLVIGDICKNKNGFLLDALDRLNAILLESELGNGGHLGVGLLFRSQTLLSTFLDELEWAKHVSFNNRLSIEYLFPANETRFFIHRNRLSDFENRDFNSDDHQIQETNLQFIQEELVNKFYPFSITTRVQPGIILRWTSRWCFSGEVWDLSIGSDFWLQRAEHFKEFKCTNGAVLSRLDIANGRNALAYQFKSIAGFGIKIHRPTYSAIIGINAEGTSWAKGIGKDITASLNIEFNF